MTDLISDEYRSLNQRLHRQRADYGKRGHRHATEVQMLLRKLRAATVLDYGAGKATLADRLLRAGIKVTSYDPCIPELSAEPDPHDIVVCTDVLEHVEPDYRPATLRRLRSLTRVAAYICVCTELDGGKTLPDGRDPHQIVWPAEVWQASLAAHYSEATLVRETARDAVIVCRP